jgi:hypothetical protein
MKEVVVPVAFLEGGKEKGGETGRGRRERANREK